MRQLGDALPMNEAAGKLHCDPSNVTGIVDRLEARGLIDRQAALLALLTRSLAG